MIPFQELRQFGETLAWVILGIMGVWILKKSLDDNKDGRLSFKEEIIPFWGMMLLTVMVISERQTGVQIYSDHTWWVIALLTGVVAIREAFKHTSIIGKAKKKDIDLDDIDRDIMNP